MISCNDKKYSKNIFYQFFVKGEEYKENKIWGENYEKTWTHFCSFHILTRSAGVYPFLKYLKTIPLTPTLLSQISPHLFAYCELELLDFCHTNEKGFITFKGINTRESWIKFEVWIKWKISLLRRDRTE